jgi:hypothetical protein
MDQSSREVDHASTGELRARIERTRADLGYTIDALHERLTPRRLMSDAMHSVTDAIVRNPIPTAVVAAVACLACWGAWRAMRA